jgi:hypothetical protein
VTAVRRDVAVVLAVQAVATALVVGWFATVLLDGDSVMRYRSDDPGWADHSFEQEVLLEALDRHG